MTNKKKKRKDLRMVRKKIDDKHGFIHLRNVKSSDIVVSKYILYIHIYVLW